MARLEEIISKNKAQQPTVRGPGGTLSQETPESIQTLSGQAGIAAPPITPLGGAALGATPKQQDMMGSVAQKQAAIAIASNPQDNLATVQRQQQANTQMNAGQQAQKQKSEEMKNLGGLGDRVESLVDAEKQKLANQATAQQNIQLQATGGSDIFSKVLPENQAAFKAKLEEWQQNPSNMQLLVDAGNLAGGMAIPPEKVADLFQTASQSIQQSAGNLLANSIGMNEVLANGDLGYSPEQLSQLLGVPQEQLQTMSLEQFQNQINALTQQEFQTAQANDQQAVSNVAGQAERGLARQMGRDLSASGVRATEADFQSLDDQIAKADQVTFGGKQYNVDELLSDENVSKVISDYLTNPDSEDSKRLAASEPALMQFIQKNQTLFSDAATAMNAGATEFSNIQSDNAQLGVVGQTKLNDQLLESIAPGAGGLKADRIDASQYPGLAYLKGAGAAGEKAVANLNDAASLSPTLGSEFAQLTPDQIKEIGVENNGPKWQQYLDVAKANKALNEVNPEDTNALLDMYFGGDVSEESVQNYMKQNSVYSTLGLPGADVSMIDSDGDGKIDAPQDILSRLKEQTSPASLSGTLDGSISKYKQGQASLPTLNQNQNKLLGLLGDAAQDGTVTGAEVNQVIKDNGGDPRNSIDLANFLSKNGNLNSEASAALGSKVLEYKRDMLDSYLTSLENAKGSDRSNDDRMKELNKIENVPELKGYITSDDIALVANDRMNTLLKSEAKRYRGGYTSPKVISSFLEYEQMLSPEGKQSAYDKIASELKKSGNKAALDSLNGHMKGSGVTALKM